MLDTFWLVLCRESPIRYRIFAVGSNWDMLQQTEAKELKNRIYVKLSVDLEKAFASFGKVISAGLVLSGVY